ncbi:hypothetical protein [Acinetobacter baumannii]|uniref:hypothetical protein n=1 Tax=Acinetobacter baumannii TaxID=470 RepID=UPI0015C57B5F|nr:hypothetical protein [Acinetobacter baumannii]
MKPEQFIRQFGTNTFRISMSFVNTAKYLVIHEGEIDFTDEIKPHHGDRAFERDVVKRLVESLDIITKVGGIHDAVEEHTKWMHAPELHEYRIGETVERLAQAIRDHKSIYGEEQ